MVKKVSIEIDGIQDENAIMPTMSVLSNYSANNENECTVYAVEGQYVYWGYTWAVSNIGHILKTDLTNGVTIIIKTGTKLASWQGVKVGSDIFTVGQEHMTPQLATVQKISNGVITEVHKTNTDDINEFIGLDVDDTYLYVGERGWANGIVATNSAYPNGGGFWKIPIATWDNTATWTRTWENPHKFEITNILKKFGKIFIICTDYSQGYWEILSSPDDDLVNWTHEYDYHDVAIGGQITGCLFDAGNIVALVPMLNTETVHLLIYNGIEWSDIDLGVSYSGYGWIKGFYDKKSDRIIFNIFSGAGGDKYSLNPDGTGLIKINDTAEELVQYHFQSHYSDFANSIRGILTAEYLDALTHGQLSFNNDFGGWEKYKRLSLTPTEIGQFEMEITIPYEEGLMNEDFSDVIFVSDDYKEVLPFEIVTKVDGTSCTFKIYFNLTTTTIFYFRMLTSNPLIIAPQDYLLNPEISYIFADDMNDGANWTVQGIGTVTYVGGVATIPTRTYLQQAKSLMSVPVVINARVKWASNNNTGYWNGLVFGTTYDNSVKIFNISGACWLEYYDGTESKVAIPNIADGNFHDLNLVITSTHITLKIDENETEYTITRAIDTSMNTAFLFNHPVTPGSGINFMVDSISIESLNVPTNPTVNDIPSIWTNQIPSGILYKTKISLFGLIAETITETYLGDKLTDLKAALNNLPSTSIGKIDYSIEEADKYDGWCKGGSIESDESNLHLLRFTCESADHPVFRDFPVQLPAYRTMTWQALTQKSFTGGSVKIELIDPTNDPLIDSSAVPLATYSLPDTADTNLPLKLGYKSDKAMQAIIRISAQNATGTVEIDTRLIENRVQHGQ